MLYPSLSYHQIAVSAWELIPTLFKYALNKPVDHGELEKQCIRNHGILLLRKAYVVSNQFPITS